MSKVLNWKIKPANEAQERFLQSNADLLAYIGGLGSGKTHIGATKALLMTFANQQATGLIAANSYKQLESATVPKVKELLAELGVKYDWNGQSKTLRLALKGFEEGVIHCRSLSEPEDLRGIEFLWAWLDETRDTKKEAFDVIIGRVRQRIALQSFVYEGTLIEAGSKIPNIVPPGADIPLVKNKIWITTTPDMMKAKWLYDYIHEPKLRNELEKRGLTIEEIHTSSKSNPYLPENYISLMESVYDKEMIEQEIEGRWIVIPPGKPVFANVFNEKVHLLEKDFDPDRPLILGVDWGFHRPAAVLMQEDASGSVHTLGELLGRDIETSTFCQQIWRLIHDRCPNISPFHKIMFYCDPAGKAVSSRSDKTDVDLAREAGFAPIFKPSRINDGIKVMRKMMASLTRGIPYLTYDPRYCPKLIEGLRGGYHYPEHDDPFSAENDNPFKDGTYDHLFDAQRYAIIHLNVVTLGNKTHQKTTYNYKPVDELTGY